MKALLPRSLLALLTLTLTAAGCGDALAFEVNAAVEEFKVPGDPELFHLGAPLDEGQVPPIPISLSGLSRGSITVVALRFFSLPTVAEDGTLTDGLDFLHHVDVIVEPTRASSTLPRRRLGIWTGPAKPGTNSLPMVVDPTFDLRPYAQDGFQLRIGTGGLVPYGDVTIKGEMRLRINPL